MTADGPIPPIGATFNESSVCLDEVTMRPTRRLTTSRDRNQTPTMEEDTRAQ